MFRRLAVFVGHFTLDAALDVVTGATVEQASVFGAIDSLVAKSMVATRPIGAMMRYRLLDTTRAYVSKSKSTTPSSLTGGRHAAYYRRWLEQSGTDWQTLSTASAAPYFASAQQCPGGSGMVLWRERQRQSASDLPPPPRRSFWRCLCYRNVIAGRGGRFSRSTTMHAARPRRCVFRRPWECL